MPLPGRAWPKSWCRSRSIRPIPIASRPTSISPRAISSKCRSARARRSAPSGRSRRRRAGAQSQGDRRALRLAAAQRETARFHRLGRTLDLEPARHGAAHERCARLSMRRRSALRIGLRRAGPPPTRMTPARARVLAALEGGLAVSKSALGRSAPPARPASSIRSSMRARSRPWRCRRSPSRCLAIRTSRRRSSRPNRPRLPLRSSPRSNPAPFRVTLLEGVTGSGKTEVYFEAVAAALARRPPSFDPDAGDRADGAVSRSLRGAFRRAAGRMAFGRQPAQARPHLERRCARRSESRRRRALGFVPAVQRSRRASSSMRSMKPPTSRTTASPIMRATWRWCAARSTKRP